MSHRKCKCFDTFAYKCTYRCISGLQADVKILNGSLIHRLSMSLWIPSWLTGDLRLAERVGTECRAICGRFWGGYGKKSVPLAVKRPGSRSRQGSATCGRSVFSGAIKKRDFRSSDASLRCARSCGNCRHSEEKWQVSHERKFQKIVQVTRGRCVTVLSSLYG